MKPRRAFTLVELLVSMIITGLVMTAVITLFFSVFKSYELHQDMTEAKQRGHIALATLQPFVLNAGLGLPNENLSNTFRDHSTPTTPLPVALFNNFSRPVQLATTPTTASAMNEAPVLWLVYSFPSRAGVDFEYQLPANSNVTIDIQNFAALEAASNLSTNKQLLKAWIAFPSTTAPFGLYEIDSVNRTLTLRSPSAQTIAAFDELHFVRAAKVFVNTATNSLMVDRLDGSGAQPVADGIAGMWCTFDPDGDRILTVRILARASTRRTSGLQGELEGWPAAAVTYWGRDSTYRHAVVSRSWRIRN